MQGAPIPLVVECFFEKRIPNNFFVKRYFL